MLSSDWKKKILTEQARESARLGRMDEVRNLLLQLQALDPDNEEISAELDRIKRGVRLKMVTSQENKLFTSTLHAELIAKGIDPETMQAIDDPQSPSKRIRKAVALEHENTPSSKAAPIKAPALTIATAPEPPPIRKEHSEPTPKPLPAHAPIMSEEEIIRIRAQKLIHQHSADEELMHHTKRSKLRRQQRTLDYCLKHENGSLSIQERQAIIKLQKRIAQDLERRSRDKNIIIGICSGLIVIVLISLCASLLLDSAKRADIRVQLALVKEDRAELIFEMQEAQRPLYLFLYPRLNTSLSQAQAWLDKLGVGKELIFQIETGKRDILSLSSEDYRAIRRLEDAKDPESAQLIQRLEAFKREKLSKDELAKVQVLEDILAAIPTATQLNNDIQQDEAALQEELQALTAALACFYDSQQIHGRKPEYMQTSQDRLLSIKQTLSAITQLKHVLDELGGCKSYQHYLQLISALKHAKYKPAQDLYALSEELPALAEINEMMRYKSKDDNSTIMLQAERSFLGDESTFSSDNPATALQVEAMEQIFQTRALSTPLYQLISNLDGKVWITESAPVADENGNLRLTRSKLDPMAKVDAEKQIFIPQKIGLILTYFNCSGLIKDCKMTREDFFRSVKILDTLTYVLQYHSDSCPAMAQGYIYQQLIKVVELHPQRALMGLSLSEELRSDILSFKSLLDKNKITLNSEDWLIPNPSNTQTEKLLRDWFRDHRQHNYSTDCKRTLRALLFAQVNYAGYVNGQGKAELHSKLDANTPIWYLDDESKKLSIGTLRNLRKAARYSPLLYASKN